MVSVTHTPLVIVPSTSSAQSARTKKKAKVSSANQTQAANQTRQALPINTPTISNSSEITVVAQQLSALESAQSEQVGYDLPQGRARQALLTYHNVMNQAQKERLSAMLGVDFYI